MAWEANSVWWVVMANYVCKYARCDQKITVIFNFSKKYLFINNYLVPFKVTPLRYNTLMPAFFPILETLLQQAFWYCQQFLFRDKSSSNVAKSFLFIGVVSFGKRKKSAGANSGEYDGWGRITFLFLAKKNQAQASMCELVRYHGAKSMIGFSTILCISDELFLAIGSQLQGSIPHWSYDLVARIHDTPRHCKKTGQKKKRWRPTAR